MTVLQLQRRTVSSSVTALYNCFQQRCTHAELFLALLQQCRTVFTQAALYSHTPKIKCSICSDIHTWDMYGNANGGCAHIFSICVCCWITVSAVEGKGNWVNKCTPLLGKMHTVYFTLKCFHAMFFHPEHQERLVLTKPNLEEVCPYI